MLNYLEPLQIIVIFIIGLLNLNAFILFFRDKRQAKKKKYRISEKTLLLSALLLGGIGALLGMNIFRHKTKHWTFKICLPIAAMITTFVVYLILL